MKQITGKCLAGMLVLILSQGMVLASSPDWQLDLSATGETHFYDSEQSGEKQGEKLGESTDEHQNDVFRSIWLTIYPLPYLSGLPDPSLQY